MLDHCIQRWKMPEHDPRRDQGQTTILLPIFMVEQVSWGWWSSAALPVPSAMKESHSNPEVSSAKVFLLVIKPLACFVGCSSRAVTRSHCGHRGDRLNEAKGSQTSRDSSERGWSTWFPCKQTATKIASMHELCCLPGAPQLGAELCTCFAVSCFC